MKRVLVRMSALATVVILGLIAIAQAQRSTNQATAVTELSTATSAPTASRRVEPIMALADAGAPRPLPATSIRPNPLRSAASSTATLEAVSTAGVSDARDPQPAADSIPDASPRVIAAYDTSSVPATERPVLAPATAPAAAPTMTPIAAPAVETSRVSPLRVAAAPAAAPSQEAAAPALVPTQSPTAAPGTGAVPNEPAPFRADPFSRSVGPSGTSTVAAAGEPMTSIPPATMLRNAGEPGPLAAADSGPLGNGTGTPGSKQLEGTQSPQLTIEKIAPGELQVGKPATFQIKVRNSGKIAASAVEIHDEIPKGTRLVSTNPPASQGVRGELVWSLGAMQPGEEMTAEVQLMPLAEGELGSVATVQLQAAASARSIATKPELVVETSAPKEVLVGEPLVLSVTVTNPGSGVATGVVLEERIPAGLQHPAGTELQYDVGTLKPKESRTLQLQLTAERPGPVTNVLTAHGDANLRAEHRLDLQVLAPRLDLAVDGPKRRYLEREASYTLAISNPGTAAAQHVELIAQLPAGLKFVSANNAGHYNEADRTVHWQLDELPMQETGTVKLVTLPVEPGEHRLLVSANAEKGVSAEHAQEVVIEGIAALMFEVVDVDDPVEKGGETTYEIRVVNQGSKAATSVQLVVNLPPEMRPLAAEGPTRHTVAGNRVLFESLSRLAPKADTTYRLRVQCLQPGDMRVQVQLLTAELRDPVTKEESTRVYSDE